MTDRSELAERLMCFDEKTNCLIYLSGPERDLIIAALRALALPSESELSRLRAEKDKLVEALAQALANCGAALRAPALPSEEEIARVIIRTCEDVGENEDEFCSDRMAVASARAVLALFAKSKGCT